MQKTRLQTSGRNECGQKFWQTEDMNADIRLLIIDPQNDFCDFPERDRPAGFQPALPVAGAHADLRRLARALSAHPTPVSHLAVTLDTHQHCDVAHPGYWMTGAGEPVAPFTTITAQAVREGAWRPRQPDDGPRTLAYLDALETTGRYALMVWPVHCIEGNWGQQIHDEMQAAIGLWAAQAPQPALIVHKGRNPYTEHYSALAAEVPVADDPATALNQDLLQWADQADALWIAGQASSHCVRATVEHLLAYLSAGAASRITLLTDCMSPVAGFEAQHHEFLDSLRSQGARLASASEMFA